jgi:hypothetical protein
MAACNSIYAASISINKHSAPKSFTLVLYLVYMVSEPTNSQRFSMANTNTAETNFLPNVTQLGSIKLEGPNYLGWVA